MPYTLNPFTGNLDYYVASSSSPSSAAQAETPSGTVNSVNVTFTLSIAPSDTNGVIVLLDGVTQYNGIDYTVSGSTITFTTAPATGSSIFSYYNTLVGSGYVPSGLISMWSGTIAAIPSGWLICDGNNGTPNLLNKFIKGVATAATNPGATGGSATASYTPAGTNSAPTLSGSTAAEAAHTHSVTSNVAVANHVFTQATIAWPVGVPTNANESSHTHSVTSNVSGTLTPAGTIAWPAGVPTAANESAHTHTYTDVPNHVHVQSVNSGTTGGLSGYTPDTSTSTSTSSGYSTANPTTGVATGTTAAGSAHTHTLSWPAGVPTFAGTSNQAVTMTNNAVTSGAGSAHTHTISWPAGVPTSSGAAVDAHAVTNNAVTSGAGSSHSHAVGTLAASAPTFTGTSASIATEPVYYSLAFIIKS